jgi:uncharacterized membrane protein YqiK
MMMMMMMIMVLMVVVVVVIIIIIEVFVIYVPGKQIKANYKNNTIQYNNYTHADNNNYYQTTKYFSLEDGNPNA